jgi:hypothetical protein
MVVRPVPAATKVAALFGIRHSLLRPPRFELGTYGLEVLSTPLFSAEKRHIVGVNRPDFTHIFATFGH